MQVSRVKLCTVQEPVIQIPQSVERLQLEERVVVGEQQKDKNPVDLVDLLTELANFAKAETQRDQSAAAETVHVVHLIVFAGNARGHPVAHFVAQSLQQTPHY